MIKIPVRYLATAAAVGLLSASQVLAAPITFIGSDRGANTLATAPNSVAARNSFAAAVASATTIDFESAPLGPVNNTPLGGGVTIDDLGANWVISNDSGGSGSLFGLNTTPGGQYFATSYSAPFNGGNLVFNFASPISAFGAYLGGLQGNAVGQQTITYTAGGTFTINIPLMDGGIAFVGFNDPGASIASVQYSFGGDYVTVDDVMYGNGVNPVPEPASMLLLGTGLAATATRMRRRAAK